MPIVHLSRQAAVAMMSFPYLFRQVADLATSLRHLHLQSYEQLLLSHPSIVYSHFPVLAVVSPMPLVGLILLLESCSVVKKLSVSLELLSPQDSQRSINLLFLLIQLTL